MNKRRDKDRDSKSVKLTLANKFILTYFGHCKKQIINDVIRLETILFLQLSLNELFFTKFAISV